MSRYDENSDQFVPILDSGNLLLMDGPIGGGINEDLKGHLWLAIYGKGLFKFEIMNLLVEKVNSEKLDANQLNGNIAIDSNNNVWLDALPQNDAEFLFFYDSNNNQTSILPLGFSQDGPHAGLLVDKEGRLWIGDYAFWKIGTPIPKEGLTGLNLIIRSPIFITRHFPFYDLRWLRPNVVFEDTSGKIWYSSFGLVSLNPKSGEWCKVFDSDSYSISIDQDIQGTFWVVSNGKIYKHD